MKTHNIVGCSRGYVERVVQSYSSLTVEKVRKYYRNALKFVNLYREGETGYTVNQRMADIRKQHRGAATFEVDHSKKAYPRLRI